MANDLMELLNQNQLQNKEAIVEAYLMGAKELIRLAQTAHPDMNLCFDVLHMNARANRSQREYNGLIEGIDL